MVQFALPPLCSPPSVVPSSFLNALTAFSCDSPKRTGPTELPDRTTVRLGDVTPDLMAAPEDDARITERAPAIAMVRTSIEDR